MPLSLMTFTSVAGEEGEPPATEGLLTGRTGTIDGGNMGEGPPRPGTSPPPPTPGS
jgi:hypothetical protein